MLSVLEGGSLARDGEGGSRLYLRVNVLMFLIDALNLIVVTMGHSTGGACWLEFRNICWRSSYSKGLCGIGGIVNYSNTEPYWIAKGLGWPK